MANFTKDQTSLYATIGSALCLLAYFALAIIPIVNISMFKALTHLTDLAGMGIKGFFVFLMIVVLILLLLAPIYTILYAYKDKDFMAPLAPAFALSPKLGMSLPLIAMGALFLVLLLTVGVGALAILATGGFWLYIIGAGVACYFGFQAAKM